MYEPLDPSMTFAKAAELWINSRTMSPASRARYISPRTLHDLQQYLRALNRKFGEVPLREIHVGLLREYQQERAETCGPNKINQELGTLVRIMRRARAWSQQLEDCYEPLQREEPDIPRAMSPEEQKLFLEVAASRDEWSFIYHYSLLALATSASNCELRGVKIGDLNFFSKVLHIRRENAKNRYRIRTIPMHDEAVWAAHRLVERAQLLGCSGASHYLMPFRVSPNLWDPAQPMSNSGIRKPWNEVRKAADVPWLRIHDLRHTAITRMAEAGVPIPVILSMAGHISVRMQQHYTSVSDYAKRCAVEAAFDGRNYMIAAGRVMENGTRRENGNRHSAVGTRLKAKPKATHDTDRTDCTDCSGVVE
ncbi:MAG TPA: site-specific integrase [Terriglobales bacterium]|nr:site-specific integrase [Terriglobales bacterium]